MQTDPTLTVCLLTLNEKDCIRNALECIKTICPDEAIAVDGYSTDGTIDILTEYNVKIVSERSNDDFGNLRTMAISYSTKDWILFIDADETLEPSLCETLRTRELLKHCQQKGIDVVGFKRKNLIDDTQEQYYKDYQYRLLKNNGKIRYVGRVHETVECTNKLRSNYCIIHKRSKSTERLIMRSNMWIKLRDISKKDRVVHSDYQSMISVPCIKTRTDRDVVETNSNHLSSVAIPHTKPKIDRNVIKIRSKNNLSIGAVPNTKPKKVNKKIK